MASSRRGKHGGGETAEDIEAEMERNMQARGRSRSRSFSASSFTSDEEGEDDDSPDHQGAGAGAHDIDSGASHGRRRSSSFVSDRDGSSSSEEENSSSKGKRKDGASKADKVSRALNLSKMALAGSTAVDPNALPKSSGKRKQTKKKTGALSKKALGTLNEGLGAGGGKTKKKDMTEEELEEQKLALEEASELKVSDNRQMKPPGAPSSVINASSAAAGMLKQATNLKSRFIGSLTRSNSTKEPKDGNTTAPNKASSDSSTKSPVDPSKGGAEKEAKRKHKLKMLLLGDSGVGKSSLIRVMSGDPFSESMLATAGVDFKLRNIEIEGEQVALQVWDTAGQERFHRITATYYKGANGIVLVYDVNDRDGFDNVGYWMNNIQQYSQPHLPAMLLVGNKIDLPNRVVSVEEGQAAAKQYNCRFLETSAKTSVNVEDALNTIAADSLFLSLNSSMSQKELMEKEKLYGVRGLKKDNCTIS